MARYALVMSRSTAQPAEFEIRSNDRSVSWEKSKPISVEPGQCSNSRPVNRVKSSDHGTFNDVLVPLARLLGRQAARDCMNSAVAASEGKRDGA